MKIQEYFSKITEIYSYGNAIKQDIKLKGIMQRLLVDLEDCRIHEVETNIEVLMRRMDNPTAHLR